MAHFVEKVHIMVEQSLLFPRSLVKAFLLLAIGAVLATAPAATAWSQEPPIDEEPPAQPTATTPAAQPAGQPAAPAAETPVNPDEVLELSLPDNMDVRVFVEYVGQKLHLKFIYNNNLTGPITIRPNQKVRVGELYDLLENSLNVVGFSMIRLPNSDWILIVPTANARQWARLLPPNEPAGEVTGESIVTETIQLQYADPKDIQDALTPFISESGLIIPLSDRGLVQIVETRKRLDQLRPLIQLIDVKPSEVEVRIIELRYTRAPDMAVKLNNILAARSQARTRTVPTPQRVGNTTRIVWQRVPAEQDQAPFIDVDERTNRLVLIGATTELDKLEEILNIYDVPRKELQVIELYRPIYLSAEDVAQAIQELKIGGMEFNASAAPVRRTTTRTTTAQRSGQPQQVITAAIGDLGGTGALPRLTVLVDTNTVVVSATPEEHTAIRGLLSRIDVKPEEFDKIRVYTLEHRAVSSSTDTSAGGGTSQTGVADILREVMESGGIDPRTKAPIPGAEDAPVIVAFEPTNSLLVSATPAQHEQITEILAQVDRRLPQVLLECTLIEVTQRNDKDMGLELEFQEIIGKATANDWHFGSTDYGYSVRDEVTGLRLFPGSVGAGGTLAWVDDGIVAALLRAIETKSNTQVLSKPRLLVNDNQEGYITSKDEEPVTELSALTTTTSAVSFKEYVEAGTTLTITPHISESNFLVLDITATVQSFTGDAASTNVPPPRSNREVQTRVTVPDQRTVVIGGLHGKRKIRTETQIPLIGDIPLLGELFKRRQNLDVKSTIYLFVKASIIRDITFQDLYDETKKAREILPEDLKELDPDLSEEAAKAEAKRLNEVLRRRAMEKQLDKGGQVNLSGNARPPAPSGVPASQTTYPTGNGMATMQPSYAPAAPAPENVPATPVPETAPEAPPVAQPPQTPQPPPSPETPVPPATPEAAPPPPVQDRTNDYRPAPIIVPLPE
ncbi:MAG: hypothetical protein GXY74_17075 [Phycisphaerae bacterium]|nr:hypothetical protein [Phycisphaerae bacterium]